MRHLRQALEQLDELISELEDTLGLQVAEQRDVQKKITEQLKASRAREAGAVAVTQKVASRLDHAIRHVEEILNERAV